MWRTTVLAAGLAVALGGAVDDLSAQGRAQGKASERYERKDERGRTTARSSGRASGRTVTRGADNSRRPEVLQGERRSTGGVYGRTSDGRIYGRGIDDRDSDRDSDRYDRRRDDRRYDPYDRYEQGRKNGPKFCQNGRGHPVHGRQWCVQKGYGLGSDRWGRVRWEDVVFGRRSTSGRVSGSVLEDVLGRVVFGRLTSQSRQLGGGPLYGNWVTTSSGPRLLQVYAGARPLAEFVDANRDGRAEIVMLNFGR